MNDLCCLYMFSKLNQLRDFVDYLCQIFFLHISKKESINVLDMMIFATLIILISPWVLFRVT